MDRGVAVNEYLETSAPGVFAAGDIARWPDPHTGERIRVEHWVVAERRARWRRGTCSARSERVRRGAVLLERALRREINYVGHAEKWDATDVEGDTAGATSGPARRAGRVLALASIYRDLDNLKAEAKFEAA